MYQFFFHVFLFMSCTSCHLENPWYSYDQNGTQNSKYKLIHQPNPELEHSRSQYHNKKKTTIQHLLFLFSPVSSISLITYQKNLWYSSDSKTRRNLELSLKTIKEHKWSLQKQVPKWNPEMEYTISFSFLTSLVEERIVLFKPKNKNYVRN
jgi:hypothetical protein